ncbi:MAG: hypothetical protein NC311_05440 [Muribaculaceae bacterium]|nr:hypothetical protein [Muribaculaceae bacterium]
MRNLLFFMFVICAMDAVYAAVGTPPTATDCASMFGSYGDRPCTSYTAREATGNYNLYFCYCDGCAAYCGYNYFVSGAGAADKTFNGWTVKLASSCQKGSAIGNVSTTSSCPSGSSKCTICKGPNFTVNGQMYCAMYSSGASTISATPFPHAAVVYNGTDCCTSDGYAADNGGKQPFIGGCAAGWTPNATRKACVCAKGYYKNGTDCTACPKYGDTSGTTADIDSQSIGACYISGGTFCDTPGCGICGADAWYKS